MGTASGIGIGIGIGVVIGIVLAVLFGIGQGTTVLENIPILDLDEEPRFARVHASYDEFDDKTTVVLYFTDNDGDNVKANGNVEITLCQEVAFTDQLTKCFSRTFDFKKDDFYTVQVAGSKLTGHQFVVDRELWGGWWWQVSMDITLEDGTTWYDVDDRFYASE